MQNNNQQQQPLIAPAQMFRPWEYQARQPTAPGQMFRPWENKPQQPSGHAHAFYHQPAAPVRMLRPWEDKPQQPSGQAHVSHQQPAAPVRMLRPWEDKPQQPSGLAHVFHQQPAAPVRMLRPWEDKPQQPTGHAQMLRPWEDKPQQQSGNAQLLRPWEDGSKEPSRSAKIIHLHMPPRSTRPRAPCHQALSRRMHSVFLEEIQSASRLTPSNSAWIDRFQSDYMSKLHSSTQAATEEGRLDLIHHARETFQDHLDKMIAASSTPVSGASNLSFRLRSSTYEDNAILKEWYDANIDDPFPSHMIADKLAHRTGFSASQVFTWMGDCRSRHGWKPQEARDNNEFTPFHSSQ